MFKRWMIGLLAALALVACGAPAGQTVARVDNMTLSRPELDKRIDLVLKALAKQPQAGTPTPSRQDVEKELVAGVNGFVNQNLVLTLAKQKGISISDTEVDALIKQFRDSIAQSGQTVTFDEVVQGALGLPSGDSTEFRTFASFFLARQKISDTLVTTDTVRAQIEQQVQAEAAKKVVEFHSAHILFAAGDLQGGTPPTDADFAAALEKANKALDRLKNGEDFAALAKELSDDPGSKDKGGEYDWTREGTFVPEYEQAVKQLKPGEYTTTAVKSQFGYHIIKLLEPLREVPALTPEQAQAQIDSQVAAQLNQARGTAFQKLLDDEIAKAKKDGRAVFPDYPEPTAVPVPAQDQPTAPTPTAAQ
ncbi:MAG: peptidylprolyl isomerase [Chloroflexi bacterium SZAS-1]|nr:peptidylprolyl isomerase [Chloroflexi bacterium SZAS-1]HNP88586.1 peptidylprolyl isomerase [Kouleothrix sp.]